ncbi:hypothetical protein J6590_107437, partial [Homalodisca vitripennis]
GGGGVLRVKIKVVKTLPKDSKALYNLFKMASGGRYRSRGLSSTHSIAARPPTVLCGRRYAAHTRRKLLGVSNSSTAAALRSLQGLSRAVPTP